MLNLQEVVSEQRFYGDASENALQRKPVRGLSAKFPRQFQPARPYVDSRWDESTGVQHLSKEIRLQVELEKSHATARVGQTV